MTDSPEKVRSRWTDSLLHPRTAWKQREKRPSPAASPSLTSTSTSWVGQGHSSNSNSPGLDISATSTRSPSASASAVPVKTDLWRRAQESLAKDESKRRLLIKYENLILDPNSSSSVNVPNTSPIIPTASDDWTKTLARRIDEANDAAQHSTSEMLRNMQPKQPISSSLAKML